MYDEKGYCNIHKDYYKLVQELMEERHKNKELSDGQKVRDKEAIESLEKNK